MAEVTGLTAERMLAIEAASVVDGDVVGDNLILQKHDGSTINAGSVRGPQGAIGPAGSDTAIFSSLPILEVGLANQIRAGRQLTPADFTNMGLSAPAGLWNLGNTNDSSGNGRNLTNKGAVTFDVGINGIINTSARLIGNSGQVLYIPDTGAADSFRIKQGSWGCWFRTARRGSNQVLISKMSAAAGNYGYNLKVSNSNLLECTISVDGTVINTPAGNSDVADDRWHFAVATFDGTYLRLYTDTQLEAVMYFSTGVIFGGSGPLNIGGQNGDAATASTNPNWGRIDEAFVTPDVLSEDEIRNLYCAKIAHGVAGTPGRASINIRRRRKGATLVAADFPTQPLRLHSFTGGALTDAGSNGQALTNNAGPTSVAGVDGSANNGVDFKGSANQNFSATDAGLPAALTARSFGAWFKTNGGGNVIGWGTVNTADSRLVVNTGTGVLRAANGTDNCDGPIVWDGQWHFAVVVEDNNAIDGGKRKLYLDGREVNHSSVLNTLTLAGANRFRIGSAPDGTSGFNGQIDEGFVCGYALTPEQIMALYLKGSQTLAKSPKSPGDHIEGIDATNLLVIFDNIDPVHQVDLAVT